MSTETKSNWQAFVDLPKDVSLTNYHKPMLINSTEIIIVERDIIYKCNIHGHEWSEWMELEDGLLIGEYSACIDIDAQLLHVVNHASEDEIRIAIIDLKKKSISRHETSACDMRQAMQSIIINHQLHIIGGWNNG